MSLLLGIRLYRPFLIGKQNCTAGERASSGVGFQRLKKPPQRAQPLATATLLHRGRSRQPDKLRLLSQAQLLDQSAVGLDVLFLQISQQTSALTNHQQQAAVGVVVVAVQLQVLVEVVDALGQQRDLNLGGAGVALVAGIGVDDFLLSHGMFLLLLIPASQASRWRIGKLSHAVLRHYDATSAILSYIASLVNAEKRILH